MVNPRTSETHPLQVNFIDRGELDLPGRIGLTFAPGKKQRDALTGAWDRDLETDLCALRDKFQTNLLVSLIEEHEFLELQIPSLRKELTAHGMEVLWFPIRDQSVPASIECFSNAVQYIVTILREGKTVVIHCKGGLGRTGLVAAAVLVAITELKPEEAISTVRQARPGAVENSEQEEYISIFHQHIRPL
jgi:protein-tyrosine phosphatase